MELPLSQFPDRIRLAMQFDPGRLADEVTEILRDDWISHFVTQNYEGDWSVIPLRGPRGAEHPVMMIYSDPTCEEFANTPFLKSGSYLEEVLSWFDCPLQAVRLMRLGVGSVIKEHRDHDLDCESGTVRLHIPVITNEDVDFRLNGERVELMPGTCWYLKLSDPHSVRNDGDEDRIHLVIDATMNDWLKDELRQGCG